MRIGVGVGGRKMWIRGSRDKVFWWHESLSSMRRQDASGSTRGGATLVRDNGRPSSLHLHTSTDMADTQVLQSPYPASTKRAAGKVDGVDTDVMVVGFADKIVITISQQGRLAQWVP